MASVKTWFMETRPHFLLLTPVTAFVGLAAAVHDSIQVNWLHFLLALTGALLAHISVNVLNDYFDYIAGIDLSTKRTPFSGGSGILPAGLLKPRDVYRLGLVCLLATFPIAGYFTYIYGVPILVLLFLMVILVYFYTPKLTRVFLAEFSAGAGFGLISFGVYYTQAGTFTTTTVLSSLIVGLMVGNLLLLNEFPDVEADKKAGRRHIPAVLGLEKASIVFAAILACVYLVALLGLFWGVFPLSILLLFLTLPLAFSVIRGVRRNFGNIEKLIPIMGKNVLLTFSVLLLTALGLLLG